METRATRLKEYNEIYREQNKLYHAAALRCAMPDCAFWIIYTLREADRPLIQRDVCSIVCQPKQTVHSALKRLEQEGYIAMTEGRDRRSKYIGLTERGEQLARSTVDHVLAAEEEAFACMTEGEQQQFLALLRRYNAALRHRLPEALERITTESEDKTR